MDIRVPNLGDGIDSASVLSILVKPGDVIEKDQTILELETDKAVAPIPASNGGKVSAIHIKIGDKLKEGDLILSVEGGQSGSASVASVPVSTPVSAQTLTPQAPPPAASTYTPVAPTSLNAAEVVTSPHIRKISQQIGLDLSRIAPTGPNGRITIEDVRGYVGFLQQLSTQPAAASFPKSSPASKPAIPLPDFSKWGPVDEKSVSSLREKIGAKMKESWSNIPHVTQFDDADITDLMALRKKYNPKYQAKNANLTVTAFAIQVAVDALKKFPIFNSSYDEASAKLIYKNYYHIGVAVDTPNGLIVPVIRDADKKNLYELATEIGALAEKARDRKITAAELQGGTFTISNLGGLGVPHFTPIINAPEVAILALGKGSMKPIYQDGAFVAKLLLPLALSYDHRVIDGADGARFMREIAQGFEAFPEKQVKDIK